MLKNNLPEASIVNFIKSCYIPDIDSFVDKCRLFYELLIAENQKYNLTRIVDEKEFWNRHIADSISIVRYFQSKFNKCRALADIGCGAGFPSIILAIAFPETEVTAIDSIGKKTAFVEKASEFLDLKNIKIIKGRSRELKIHRKFNIVTARAVSEPVKIYTESKNWITKNGKYIFYQTPQNIDSKLATVNSLSHQKNIIWDTTETFLLPGGEKRVFLHSSVKR